MTKLEICTNTEWVRDSLDLEGVPEVDHNEAANDFTNKLWNALESAGFEVEGAKDQRRMFHGWNGANTFRHKFGNVATFDELTQGEQAAIYTAMETAEEATSREWIAAATD